MDPVTRSAHADVTVELLYWAGCPSVEAAIVMLRKELAQRGATEAHVRMIPIVSQEDAVREGFAGSPTLRVNARDVVPDGGPSFLGCRVYRLRTGTISALPDIQDLRDALDAALRV